MELARERPTGIQLLRLDGVPGRDSGFDPGMAKLSGLLISRPRLCGRETGELGALLARSWLTIINEGGGGRLSRSRGCGIVRGSEEKIALGVETWRVGLELLRCRLSVFENPGEVGEDCDSSFGDEKENRDEMRFADLTGADNILGAYGDVE